MSQSIGDASNASYVFDGSSTHPRGEYTQLMRAGLANQGATAVIPGDNRSLSNESSPSNNFQRRNLMYRNVRNFNNLYENR